jgi:iron complex transport system ATP-binding protein
MMLAAERATLTAERITVGVDGRVLVDALDFSAGPGELIAVLGRNGTGKTLSLLTLAGLRAPDEGRVVLDGVDLREQSRRATARRIGFLAQDPEEGFEMTVEESVLLGRHPHLRLFQWETEADREIARNALRQVDLEGFAARSTATLSGGERRRVAVAALLAQSPQVFLLDEPTNHLDPQHQLAVLELFRARARAGAGATVIATLHDPNLAARYADRALLLFGDGRWLAGPARELLCAEKLGELYNLRLTEGRIAGRPIFAAE